MDYVFSIFMFIFSAAILLYAGLMVLTKDYKMLPLRVRKAVKPKDKKQYTANLAKAVALVAAAPALSGAVGFLNIPVAVIVLIAGLIASIWLGTRIMKSNT